MVWVRISGLVLLIVGVLSSLFIPTWDRDIAIASVALIIVGSVAMVSGTRRKKSQDGVSGGVYGDASGLNTDYGSRYHPDEHDGGHGGDISDGGGH